MENNVHDFEVKRGMVFFLEEPGKQQHIPNDSEYAPLKKRPYIVLSSDKINLSSGHTIQVAPIFTRDPDTCRPWNIPFKGVNNRNQVVDCSVIMSIPKELCNSESYDAHISQYTRFNKNLFEGIARAIINQLCISSDILNAETERVRQTYPVYNAPIPVTAPVAPNITLNINLNGVPVNIEDSCVTQDENNTTITLTNEIEIPKQENVVEESNDNTSQKVVRLRKYSPRRTGEKINEFRKFILENSKQFNGTMSVQEIANELKISIPNVGYHIRKIKENQNMLKNGFTTKEQILLAIEKNYKGFGGTYTQKELCKLVGLSHGTISKYVKIIKNKNNKPITETSTSTKGKRAKRVVVRLNTAQEIQFLNDYEAFGPEFTYNKYKHLGFRDIKTVYRKAHKIRDKIKKGLVKK